MVARGGCGHTAVVSNGLAVTFMGPPAVLAGAIWGPVNATALYWHSSKKSCVGALPPATLSISSMAGMTTLGLFLNDILRECIADNFSAKKSTRTFGKGGVLLRD